MHAGYEIIDADNDQKFSQRISPLTEHFNIYLIWMQRQKDVPGVCKDDRIEKILQILEEFALDKKSLSNKICTGLESWGVARQLWIQYETKHIKVSSFTGLDKAINVSIRSCGT